MGIGRFTHSEIIAKLTLLQLNIPSLNEHSTIVSYIAQECTLFERDRLSLTPSVIGMPNINGTTLISYIILSLLR